MSDIDWPQVVLILGLIFLALLLLGGIAASFVELRRLRINEALMDEQRQLVQRYEKLAETTLDAQQRVAVDVAELRSRTASIEKILQTVD
jgi:hypothetical protein